MKRQGRVTQVLAQPLAGSQEHVLDDIAGIDPAAQRPIQPQSNHPPQGRAVTLPKFVRGGRIGLLNLFQEPLGFLHIWPHPSIPVQAKPAACELPLVSRPVGSDRAMIRTDSPVYRPVHEGGHPFRWEHRFPLSALAQGELVNVTADCAVLVLRSTEAPEINIPLEEFAMYYAVYAYIAYLFISISVTIWVARALSRNGRVFLIDTFLHNEALADAVNNLLVVGFYLINVGYVALALRYGERPTDPAGTIETMSTKVGLVLLVLGGMHFFNLYVFSKMRRKALLRNQKPPVSPEQFVSPVHSWNAAE